MARSINQIDQVIEQIKKNPDSRRHIVSAWNAGEIDKMNLAPCHALFQFYVVDGELSCQLYQRSADLFLGVPFNIASYALLTMMVAQVCDLKPGEFVHTFGDLHLYSNHLEQAKLQLSREPRALPHDEIESRGEEHPRFQIRGFRARRLRPASRHQGADCGVVLAGHRFKCRARFSALTTKNMAGFDPCGVCSDCYSRWHWKPGTSSSWFGHPCR